MKTKFSLYHLLVFFILVFIHSSLQSAQLLVGTQTYANTASNGGNFTNVSLSPSFSQTPIVFVLPTNAGGHAANVRVKNVTTSSFEAAPTEPHSHDGVHAAMTSTSIAVDSGNFFLPDLTQFEVGSVDVSAQQFGTLIAGAPNVSSWHQVTFNEAFTAPPIVVATIQTMNNEVGESGSLPPSVSSLPFLDVAISNVTTTGFLVALERSEVQDGDVNVAESIGYMAVEASTGSFVDANNNTVDYKAFSYDGARGWNDTCVTSSFPGTAFSSTPIVMASKRTRNNPDGGWLRRCSLSSSAIGIEIDESYLETEGDSERNLSISEAESISVIAFSEGFELGQLFTEVPNLEITKQLITLSDPVNGNTNPKSIPGAIIEYSIIVTNSGEGTADAGTIELNDVVPDNTSLVVSGLNCGGAVNHLDSSSPTDSGLACGVVEFAKADGVFGYTPVASGSNNTDTLVRYIRIKPSGEFKGSVGSGDPYVTFKFRVELN